MAVNCVLTYWIVTTITVQNRVPKGSQGSPALTLPLLPTVSVFGPFRAPVALLGVMGWKGNLKEAQKSQINFLQKRQGIHPG